jgi:hypothetical protein
MKNTKKSPKLELRKVTIRALTEVSGAGTSLSFVTRVGCSVRTQCSSWIAHCCCFMAP